MELLFDPIILSLIVLTVGIVTFYITINGIRDLRKIEPIVEKEQKEKEERRAKLRLDSSRIPLYFDDETLESLYSQSKMGDSPQIDQTKRVTIFESNQKLDTKIASMGTRTTESEEQIIKKDESKERKFVTILNWLSDTDQLVTDINSSNVAIDLIEDLEKVIYKKNGKIARDIPLDVTNSMAKVLAWKNEDKAEKTKLAKNKPIFITSDFSIAQVSEEHNQFHIFSEDKIQYHVGGFIDCCTKMGKDLILGAKNNKFRIFGYVSSVDEKDYDALYIEAIAIHL